MGDATHDYQEVCRLEEIPEGRGRKVTVDGRELAVFRVQGRVYAIENSCLHAGGPLHEGAVVEGTIIACPWHGWRYDLRTGTTPMNPYHRLSCHPVRVRDGAIEVGFEPLE